MLCNTGVPEEYYISLIRSYFFDNQPPFNKEALLQKTGIADEVFNGLKENEVVKEFLTLLS